MSESNCSKEEEWINMAERIAKVEVKQDMTNDKIDKIDIKLDKFIDTCDNKFATKNEVKAVEEKIAIVNKNQDERLQFIYGKTWKLTKDLSTLAGTVALLTKLMGLW